MQRGGPVLVVREVEREERGERGGTGFTRSRPRGGDRPSSAWKAVAGSPDLPFGQVAEEHERDVQRLGRHRPQAGSPLQRPLAPRNEGVASGRG